MPARSAERLRRTSGSARAGVHAVRTRHQRFCTSWRTPRAKGAMALQSSSVWRVMTLVVVTNVGAVQAKPDALHEIGNVLLAQISVGVSGACLNAVVERVDSRGQCSSVRLQHARVPVQHGPRDRYSGLVGACMRRL